MKSFLRKHLKRIGIITALIAAVIFIGMATIITVVTEITNAIIGEEENSKIDSSALDGLPEWITLDMVKAAIEMMEETHYPASVVLGQMILEAGAEGSKLANPPYYNCLGQKSPSYGESGTVSMTTEEAWGTIVDTFSTFDNYIDCMRAWGHKFTMAPYASYILACPREPTTGHYVANAFIQAVKDGGYATDPAYVDKVISIMQTYDLYKFNTMSVSDLEKNWEDITGTGRFTHPCPDMTYQSSYFGEIREFEPDGHKGNDYAAPEGTPTYAADAGTVTTAGWSSSAGNWVVIDHGNGLVTKYMHHSKILVSQGQTVKKGQQIGEVGSTGQSTGPHLHFQVEENGVAVDPDKYLY